MSLDRSPYLNWDAVGDPHAATALAALLPPERMARRWAGLPTEARDLHRGILSAFLVVAEAPEADAIAASAGAALAELLTRDLVFRDGGRIGAYPFAPGESGHRVRVGGTSFRAVCVIDAFGIAAMAGGPACIETRCPDCSAEIAFDAGGSAGIGARPAGALVWAAPRDTGGCAATSQCRTMRAFCTTAHLEAWAGPEQGFRLSARQAAQVGAAIFGPGSAFGAALAKA